MLTFYLLGGLSPQQFAVVKQMSGKWQHLCPSLINCSVNVSVKYLFQESTQYCSYVVNSVVM